MPVRVGAFDWKFEGCPHVGGGLTFAMGEHPAMHAVVWTGNADRAGVYHLTSHGDGATWSKPHRLGEETASHPDLAVSGAGRVAAVWDESQAGVSSILASESRDGGGTWSAPVKLSGASNSASHPRIVAVPEGFRAFWTESSVGGKITLGSAALPTRR
jgi:hypothetical protein